MVFHTLLFVSRKEGISTADFKNHYENTHMPLVKSMAGDNFPLLHRRMYIGRSSENATSGNSSAGAETPKGADERVANALGLLGGSGGAPGAPLIVAGKPEDFKWDATCEINFTDEEHFKKFMGVFMDAENAKRLAEDEENFIDRSKVRAVIIGDVGESVNEKL